MPQATWRSGVHVTGSLVDAAIATNICHHDSIRTFEQGNFCSGVVQWLYMILIAPWWGRFVAATDCTHDEHVGARHVSSWPRQSHWVPFGATSWQLTGPDPVDAVDEGILTWKLTPLDDESCGLYETTWTGTPATGRMNKAVLDGFKRKSLNHTARNVPHNAESFRHAPPTAPADNTTSSLFGFGSASVPVTFPCDTGSNLSLIS